MEMKRLTERVYMTGHDHATDRPALGAIVGERATLIVDSGNSAAHARLFLEQLAAVPGAEPRYLALTHWHWDHVFGAAEMDLTTIAHPLTQQKLRQMQSYRWDDAALQERVQTGEEIAFCAENIIKEHPGALRESIAIRPADILYDGRMTVDLGGVTCEIFSLGGEHSADSTAVYCPQEQVLFLGDGMCQEMFEGPWSYDLPDYEARLQKIEGLPCKWYVNAHWDPQNADDFARAAAQMRALGKLVGAETDGARVYAQYRRQYGAEPDEAAREILDSYLWGNRKRGRQPLR
ncbi:hydroxyacylglutathione hydrolase [Anaerotruncus sp. 2789STDY5834896]|uniref:Hydroxyacylglutathione hydrolase n=1 Tax=uncultured Anaerotruncus sp. TaxID=905011 RepID=A0A1C6JJ66_9FIRM|nr:hydroxyacylglutathione hydrolase [uncultured Anaerotruncus sp.]